MAQRDRAEPFAAGVAREVAASLVARGVRPGLAVVLVGDDPASAVYVRGKGQGVAKRRGCTASRSACRPTASEAELLAHVDRLNADPAIHGILVQMPLPKHIDPPRS